jgi:hypothetical protein
MQAIYITAELSAPARQLPLAINTAIPTIILCFIATNAAYYILLPWDVISQTDSVAVVSSPPAASTSLRLISNPKDRYSSTPWSRRRHSSRNSDLSGSSGFFTWKFLRRWPHDRCGCEPELAPSLFCLYWTGWRSIQLNYQLIGFSEDISVRRSSQCTASLNHPFNAVHTLRELPRSPYVQRTGRIYVLLPDSCGSNCLEIS